MDDPSPSMKRLDLGDEAVSKTEAPAHSANTSLSNEIYDGAKANNGDTSSDDEMPELEEVKGSKKNSRNDSSMEVDDEDKAGLDRSSGSSTDVDTDDDAVTSSDQASDLLVQATSMKEEGNQHFKEGKLDQAARSYRRGSNLLKKKLSNYVGDDQVKGCWIALQTNLSMVLSKQGKHKASADVASKVLEREPNHVKALFRRAMACRQMGDLDKARDDLRTAIKAEPNNVACKKELLAIKKEIEQTKEMQKKALAKAFSNKSSSLLYNDKETEERRKEEKKRLEKQAQQELYKKRKQEWEDECVKRMAQNEPAVSFEDWEKEQKEKEKQKREEEEKQRKLDEQRRKEERKKRREAERANSKSGSDSDDDELTEKELALMRGYKKTKDGRTTSYFTRELSEEEKRAYDIAPKRLNEVSNTAPTRLTSSSDGSEGKGVSAWNLAGTWEEKDTSSWCTTQLRKRLEDTTVTSVKEAGLDVNVVAVEGLEGHASVAMAGGKKRYIFEYEASLKYEIKSDDDSVVASGLARLPDICSTHHDELEVSFDPWTKRPASDWENKVMAARTNFGDQVRLQVQNWVVDFNNQY